MLLLVTDTSGKNGFVGLARGVEGDLTKVELIEEVPLAGGTFSAQLVPQIAALLEKHGFRKTDIGGFIVVSGPGSFTGLRVGLAAIKALAEVWQKPIASVSLLEVIALASGKDGEVLAALDGGRGEVYAGEYDVAGDFAHCRSEHLIARSDFLSTTRAGQISTPDATLALMARDAGLSVFSFPAVSAEMIARLGWKKLQRGQAVSAEQLEANYMRRSDAEIFAKPVSSSSGSTE